MKKLTLLSAMIFAVISLTAQIIHVPADQPTIQAGIDASSDGDTVLVSEGTYFENINFNGMAVTVASEFIMDDNNTHISNTIIDGSQASNPNLGSVVTFDSGEDTTSILCGFTITGGTGTSIQEGPVDAKGGGGIFIDRSGAKLLYNYILANEVIYDKLTMGGGLVAGGFINPQPTLIMRGNKIRYNKSVSTAFQAKGGGLEVYCNLVMIDNDISYNEANGTVRSLAGGVSLLGMFGHINLNVRDNTIHHNKSISNTVITENSQAGGLLVEADVSGTISNNIISDNSLEVHPESNCYGAGALTYNISTDLIFENNIIKDNNFINGYCVGGGLCIWSGGGTYQNNVIRNNAGTWGAGVAVGYNNSDSLAVLINNTITGNFGAYGGGLYALESEIVVVNTILWDNEASEEGDEIFELESNLEVSYSNVQGVEEWPGQGNINTDPGFVYDGYHLALESMLVNQGASAVNIGGEWYDCPEYDIDGDERPFDGTEPDIGADEAQWYHVDIHELESTKNSSLTVFPNPVVSTATIKYQLELPYEVQLSLYNQQGKLVEMLVNKQQSKGEYQVTWNFENLPNGIYFCFLQTKDGTQSTKMIKLK